MEGGILTSVLQTWGARLMSLLPIELQNQEFVIAALVTTGAIIVSFIIGNIAGQATKVRAVDVKVAGPGLAKRNHRFHSLVDTPWEGGRTIPLVFEQACKKHGNNKLLGKRHVIEREMEKDVKSGRSFEKLTLGEYSWETYSEVLERVHNLGSGLVAIGHENKKKLAIFAETCPEWFIAFQAAARHQFVVVTVYASLGEDALWHCLNEAECTTVVCDGKQLLKLANVVSKLTTVKRLVVLAGFEAKPDIPENFKVFDYAQTELLGKHTPAEPQEPPSSSDLAVIMYTSGSTGPPKGVMLSHGNLVASAAAVPPIITALDSSDTYMGYLPLAHVLELVAELTFASMGAKIGYGSPLTLTDNGSKLKKGTKGDIAVLQPTLMATVPEILDRVKGAVLKQIDTKGEKVKRLFQTAYRRRLKAIEGSWFGAWGIEQLFWDHFVFSRVRAALGGKLRGMLSGGAPLSADTQRFMNICFSIPIGQGYGLTETCAAGAFSEWDDTSVGRVGPPLPSVYIKLVDWDEGGYHTTDQPFPRGEIMIGGPSVSLGYLKNPEKTKEDFSVDSNGIRWFSSGDIGLFFKDGTLQIIDRKKDIVKLSHGEYTSLGKVETQMKTSPYVSNIMVYADSLQSHSVALVVIDKDAVEAFAKKQGISYSTVQDLVGSQDLEKEVLSSFLECAKKGKLNKFDIPARVKLLAEPWTPESGLVTAAFKIKREAIKKAYGESLNALYMKS